MEALWLLRGDHTAPGWGPLEKDSREDKVNLMIFDRAAWALVRANEAPDQYAGLTPEEPPDGMYVSEQGFPIYVKDRQEVVNGRELIQSLGEEAQKLFAEIGDDTAVLQRLGKVY